MAEPLDPVSQARTIGERVRTQRTTLGWSPYRLAVRAAVPLEEVSAIEEGAELPSAVTIARLALALAVNATWLMGLADYL